MKILICSLITILLCSSAYSQLTFKNNNPQSPLCKIEFINGKTSIYEDVNNTCPVFHTWNQVPAEFLNDYSNKRYKMTVTVDNSIAKRTYYIEYRMLSGAGENRGKKNTAYVKLTIDFKAKGRATKVLEEYFTIAY